MEARCVLFVLLGRLPQAIFRMRQLFTSAAREGKRGRRKERAGEDEVDIRGMSEPGVSRLGTCFGVRFLATAWNRALQQLWRGPSRARGDANCDKHACRQAVFAADPMRSA